MPLSLVSHPVGSMQAFNSGFSMGKSQLIAVGTSTLYYVILSQIQPIEDDAIKVFKSIDGITWSLVATYSNGPGTISYQDAPCFFDASTNTIYIVGVLVRTGPSRVNLIVHEFHTNTDTFVGDSSIGPLQGGAGEQLATVSPLNSGLMLISSTTAALFGPPGAPLFQIQTYDPLGDLWSVPITLVADSSRVLHQIHDPATDLTFIFYQKGATPNEIRCITVDNTLAFTDVHVVTFVFGHGLSNQSGLPCITVGTNEVIFPYRDNDTFNLMAARSPIQAAPVFTLDLVEDTSTLPVSSFVQQWDQIAGPGWMAQEIAGLLYVFYDIDNGELDNASSQSFLYYRTSTGPGVWSGPLIAYTSVVPGEMLIPYGTKLPGVDPVILVGIIDPTLWPAFASLTQFILMPGSGPPPPTPIPSTPIIKVDGLANVILPNPAGKCS